MRQPPSDGPRTVECTATAQYRPERAPRRTSSSSCSRVTGWRSTAGRDDSAPAGRRGTQGLSGAGAAAGSGSAGASVAGGSAGGVGAGSAGTGSGSTLSITMGPSGAGAGSAAGAGSVGASVALVVVAVAGALSAAVVEAGRGRARGAVGSAREGAAGAGSDEGTRHTQIKRPITKRQLLLRDLQA